ncbi:MAG: hypothetical protein U9Q30_09915 [Campylobacterota bacterium]|nr:hypothetical protein [Campylobacterota bacterium]
MNDYQKDFYKIITNQMLDYNEGLHELFIINRIHQIDERDLRFLLENINVDKDNITNKKGYITYVKFIHYADKMINYKVNLILNKYKDKTESLYNKRELLLKTISAKNLNIEERNKLVEDIELKKLMFKDNKTNKNMLDYVDYFIISKIGYNNFFNENKNHMIKENMNRYLKEYGEMKLLQYNNQKLIGVANYE